MPPYQTNVPFDIILDLEPEQTPVSFVTIKGNNKSWQIPIYVDADGIAHFRFCSSQPGHYNYRHKTIRYDFEIIPYAGVNVLFAKGAPAKSRNHDHLVYQNGEPFFYLADTWWYGMTGRASYPNPFCQLAELRQAQGFSVIQIVIGYPPETKTNSKNAKNSGGSVIDEFGQINPGYFAETDKKINELIQSGLVPCIFGSWGHHIDSLGINTMKSIWREIIARYASYPVIWCLTGEVDIPARTDNQRTTLQKIKRVIPSEIWRLMKVVGKPRQNYDGRPALTSSFEAWGQVAEHIKSLDPWDRLLTVHTRSTVSGFELFQNPAWLDIIAIQSGHTKKGVCHGPVAMVNSITSHATNGRIVINLEPWYEGIHNNFGAQDQRYAFWACMLSGAKGHAYGAHGLWQMATDHDNFLDHWGKSNWQEAKDLKGASHIAQACRFLQNLRWWTLGPVFEQIDPHWSAANPSLPLTAQMDDKSLIIYFPDSNQADSYNIHPGQQADHYLLSWLNPSTMQLLQTKYIEANVLTTLKPISPNDTDALLLIQPKHEIKL